MQPGADWGPDDDSGSGDGANDGGARAVELSVRGLSVAVERWAARGADAAADAAAAAADAAAGGLEWRLAVRLRDLEVLDRLRTAAAGAAAGSGPPARRRPARRRPAACCPSCRPTARRRRRANSQSCSR